MSTSIARAVNPSPLAIENKPQGILSFSALIEWLDALRALPSLSDIEAWLRDVRVTENDLRLYRAFKPGTYARHRVVRGEFAELLALCWLPGQRTPIHDHDGSFGAVRVCEGVMWETMFALNDARELYYQSAREWRSGQVTGASVPDIHQLGNPEVSGQDLVTLHLYAPPLNVLNTYRVGSSITGSYMPEEFKDGAGI